MLYLIFNNRVWFYIIKFINYFNKQIQAPHINLDVYSAVTEFTRVAALHCIL